ncbi:MAG: hypothetical protein HYX78_11565 [Armatimonadetes bacterium]|nr:hypothetical protein [Armatimonadota bacterium]
MHREERGAGQIGFSEKDFKVCDLCGALNRVTNNECFVCGWAGTFHYDPDTVREAMKQFEEHYGGISETLLAEEILPDERTAPGVIASLIEKIKQFLNGRDTA